jgi:uncharacterized protein with HEPN domain
VPRDPGVFLDDIVEACRKIGRYTSGLTNERFRLDEKTVDAVVRNLEVIGEAVKKLPDSTRRAISGIEWSRIAGLRNILVPELLRRVEAHLAGHS